MLKNVKLITLFICTILFIGSALSQQNSTYTITIGQKEESVSPLSDKDKNDFQTGKIKFDCWFSCQFKFNRQQMRSLFNEKKWNDLVALSVQSGFEEDLNYFYLGYGAEMLGFPEAAETYYKLGKSTKEKCKSESTNFCTGFNLKEEFDAKLIKIKEAIYAKNNGVTIEVAKENLEKLRQSRSKFYDGVTSVGEKDPEGGVMKLGCGIAGFFPGREATYKVTFDFVNGLAKLSWAGGNDTLMHNKSNLLHDKEVDLIISKDSRLGTIYGGAIDFDYPSKGRLMFIVVKSSLAFRIGDSINASPAANAPWGRCV